MPSYNEQNKGENAPASPLTACVRFILGRQLANREIRAREIGAAEAVPALGLDSLSSTAYGPEAALTILSAAGVAGLAYLGPVMLTILALLGILFISYWQTIEAYPKSGGAYTVSQANLGVNASLLAAAALMIDYVLNVAVGISAFDASASGIKTTVTYFLNDWLGVEGSFTGAFAPALQNGGSIVKMALYGGGPKIAWRQKRWEPWAHGIFGGAHAHPQTAVGSQNSYSIMAGGGADYRWNPRVSFRLEGDYVRTGFYHQSQNNFQLAGGIVFHF